MKFVDVEFPSATKVGTHDLAALEAYAGYRETIDEGKETVDVVTKRSLGFDIDPQHKATIAHFDSPTVSVEYAKYTSWLDEVTDWHFDMSDDRSTQVILGATIIMPELASGWVRLPKKVVTERGTNQFLGYLTAAPGQEAIQEAFDRGDLEPDNDRFEPGDLALLGHFGLHRRPHTFEGTSPREVRVTLRQFEDEKNVGFSSPKNGLKIRPTKQKTKNERT